MLLLTGVSEVVLTNMVGVGLQRRHLPLSKRMPVVTRGYPKARTSEPSLTRMRGEGVRTACPGVVAGECWRVIDQCVCVVCSVAISEKPGRLTPRHTVPPALDESSSKTSPYLN